MGRNRRRVDDVQRRAEGHAAWPGGARVHGAHRRSGAVRFVQISDSHIGFDKPANTDVTATLRAAIAKIKAAPEQPSFILHTGDLTHLSKPAEFDTLQQVLSDLSMPVFYVPANTTCSRTTARATCSDSEKARKVRLAQLRPGRCAFHWPRERDHLKAGGLGSLGKDQLEWLEKDVKRLKSSTPVVVFAHIPLWAVYPEWGWVPTIARRRCRT